VGEELGPALFHYSVTDSYDTEISLPFHYSIVPSYDMGYATFHYRIGTVLYSGMGNARFHYKIKDPLIVTSPAPDGGAFERVIECFQGTNPNTVIDGDGYQARGVLKAPLPADYHAYFAVKVFLQTPELPTKEILIPQKDIISVTCKLELNRGIMWSLSLKNYDRKYTDRDNATFGGLITKGMYSYARETRKFIRMQFCCIYDGVPTVKYDFPRLVIKQKEGTKEITIGGIDEITEFLYSRCDLETYCVEENLLPVETSKVEVTTDYGTDTFYTRWRTINLTSNWNDPTTTQILVNYAPYTGGSYNSTSRELATGQVNTNYPVTMLNPISVHNLIKDLCTKTVDRLPAGVTKEYFPVNLDFPTYMVKADVPVQGKEPIKVIEELISVVPGEWFPQTIGDRLGLVIRRRPIEDEFPSVGKFVLRESTLKEKLSISSSNVDRINTINVIRPSVVRTAYKQVITTEEE